MTVNNTGDIDVTGTIGTDGGAVNLVTTGGVTVNSSISSGAGSITLQGDSGGTGANGVVSIGALGSVTGTGNTITLQASDIDINAPGVVNAGSGTVNFFASKASETIGVGTARGRHSDQQHGAWPGDHRDPRLRRRHGADRKHHL